LGRLAKNIRAEAYDIAIDLQGANEKRFDDEGNGALRSE